MLCRVLHLLLYRVTDMYSEVKWKHFHQAAGIRKITEFYAVAHMSNGWNQLY